MAKALDDCFVAYGQNGDVLRVEQGYPIRAIVPGWEGPFNVKYLKHIKVVDQPYNTWNESMNHSVSRPDLGGKARWYHYMWAVKSVITRPSAGMEMRKGYAQITGPCLVRCGQNHESRYFRRRRQELEGSENPGARALQSAYALYVRLGVGRTGSHALCPAPRMRPATFSPHWRSWASIGKSRLRIWKKPEKPRAIHMNAIQPWKIARDGSITDAMFT